jgi:hypothetical protein
MFLSTMEKDAILEIIPTAERLILRSPEVSIKVFDHLLKHSRIDVSSHLVKLSESCFSMHFIN